MSFFVCLSNNCKSCKENDHQTKFYGNRLKTFIHWKKWNEKASNDDSPKSNRKRRKKSYFILLCSLQLQTSILIWKIFFNTKYSYIQKDHMSFLWNLNCEMFLCFYQFQLQLICDFSAAQLFQFLMEVLCSEFWLARNYHELSMEWQVAVVSIKFLIKSDWGDYEIIESSNQRSRLNSLLLFISSKLTLTLFPT